MEDLKKSLIDFVRRYKSSGYRKKKLLEDLEYVIHQMYSVSGPVYDRVGGTTNVKPDRFLILLDKKDRIERALIKIEEELHEQYSAYAQDCVIDSKNLKQIYPPVDKFEDSELAKWIKQIESMKYNIQKVK